MGVAAAEGVFVGPGLGAFVDVEGLGLWVERVLEVGESQDIALAVTPLSNTEHPSLRKQKNLSRIRNPFAQAQKPNLHKPPSLQIPLPKHTLIRIKPKRLPIRDHNKGRQIGIRIQKLFDSLASGADVGQALEAMRFYCED